MSSAMVTSGAITQRLDKLENEGLVIRRSSADDGRRVVVELTDAGLARIDETLPDHLATETRLLGMLSPEEQGILALSLKGLLQSLEPVRD